MTEFCIRPASYRSDEPVVSSTLTSELTRCASGFRSNSAKGSTKLSPAPSLKLLVILTGHYGVGKTTCALSLAHDFAEAGEKVTLVDLDIVNPYFRSSDHRRALEAAGIDVVAPTFAATTLDAPSLPAALGGALEREGRVIVDVGGDDAGATALGRFRAQIAARDYDLLYVVNARRNLTSTPQEAVAILREIEDACGLQATGIVDNTHLQNETTDAIRAQGETFAAEVARQTDLPLVSIPRSGTTVR